MFGLFITMPLGTSIAMKYWDFADSNEEANTTPKNIAYLPHSYIRPTSTQRKRLMETQAKNQCQTLERYEQDGTPVYKDKKKFNTLDEAIAECKKENAMPHRIHKVVSYKCNVCHKYHIGRNGKKITAKLRTKLQVLNPTKEELDKRRQRNQKIAFEFAEFKVVGKIDLSKIPKK